MTESDRRESERRQRVIDSSPKLTPDDVASRTFAKGVRGYSEAEVRSFLRRVSEELIALREREQQLLITVDELEEQLRAPRPLDEQQLLDVLGEESARLLRTAREAGDDIRRKAEETATRLLEETRAEADRLGTEAAEAAGSHVQDAEARAAEMIAIAEAEAADVRASNARAAEAQRLAAEQEIEGVIGAARVQGREMLDEARAARERVLSDLARRRGLLQSQVEELRQGRDHLLDAYRVVKRTFLEATEALAHVEARAAAGKPIPSADTADIDAAIAAEAESASVDVAAHEAEEAREQHDDTEPRTQLDDVDSLFARLRAGHDEVAVTDEPVVDVSTEDETGDQAEQGDEGDQPADQGDAALAPGAAADAWRARHDADVSGLLSPLVKRAKRAAEDDQNALLDAVRRHKGRPAAVGVLPDEEALVAAWVEVLGPALDDAYRSGRVAAGGVAADTPPELRAEAAASIISPLRERVVAAIDDAQTDATGLVERIGARYREWKNQQLEKLLADAIVFVWSRGVFDGSAEGTVLHWIPLHEGRCADCDDNALEPTAKGSTFPTGQPFPPAHPGCRCLLAPADALNSLPRPAASTTQT